MLHSSQPSVGLAILSTRKTVAYMMPRERKLTYVDYVSTVDVGVLAFLHEQEYSAV